MLIFFQIPDPNFVISRPRRERSPREFTRNDQNQRFSNESFGISRKLKINFRKISKTTKKRVRQYKTVPFSNEKSHAFKNAKIQNLRIRSKTQGWPLICAKKRISAFRVRISREIQKTRNSWPEFCVGTGKYSVFPKFRGTNFMISVEFHEIENRFSKNFQNNKNTRSAIQNSAVFSLRKSRFQKRKNQQFENSEQKPGLGSAQGRRGGEICAENFAKLWLSRALHRGERGGERDRALPGFRTGNR